MTMPLDLQYLRYCQPGNPFYAPPNTAETLDTFDAFVEEIEGWESKRLHPWVNWYPSDWIPPRQGWKIHVSATTSNAHSILSITADYCHKARLPFKHLSSPRDLLTQNGKYADRASAGKFITAYPASDDQFSEALRQLNLLLEGQEGPYILSDRRWKTGPVYFRYGAFVPPSKGSGFISTLIDPSGAEIEDPRRPAFTPPAWARLPDSVSKAMLEDDADVNFGFSIRSALHFSNSGGVYLAEALTDEFVPRGTIVVLKEARPHAGLDGDGTDAVARLIHEEEVLTKLQGLSCVPAFYGSFTAWEHRYIVMERVIGDDLKREWMKRTPVLRPQPWNLIDASYSEWLTASIQLLDDAVATIHTAGWLLGDIHPKNVIMRDGTKPCFIDFEFAHPVEPQWRCQQGAPGYEPMFGLTGRAADSWSLGMMKLDLLYPQATIADQGNTWKIEQLLRMGTHKLAISDSVVQSIRRSTLDVLPRQQQLEATAAANNVESLSDIQFRNEIRRGLISVMNWNSEGPVIPGDISVFAQDGAEHRAGYPYGAAGIVDQLSHCPGAIDFNTADVWLADRVSAVTSRGLRGRDGIEYVARTVGLRKTLDALECTRPSAPTDPTLWSGWAGVGLSELALGGDPLESAHRLAELLNDETPGGSVGLLNGWCAGAILFAKLYEATGDDALVSLATRAIEADLSECAVTRNGTIEFDEGWRTLPYLGIGSLGVGLAILELQRVTGTSMFADTLARIDASATYNQCAQASIAHGLSGFIVYLKRRTQYGSSPNLEEAIQSHLRSLRLHAVVDDSGMFFRGNQNLRLSADYLTGAAGVLAALDEMLDGDPALPFGI